MTALEKFALLIGIVAGAGALVELVLKRGVQKAAVGVVAACFLGFLLFIVWESVAAAGKGVKNSTPEQALIEPPIPGSKNGSVEKASLPESLLTGAKEPSDSAAPLTNSIGMVLVRIEPGSFTMGSSDAQLSLLRELYPSVKEEFIVVEQPPHPVRISQPFYLGMHEVTVGQFRQFVAETGYKTDAERDGEGGWAWNGETGKLEQNARINWLNPGFSVSLQPISAIGPGKVGS